MGDGSRHAIEDNQRVSIRDDPRVPMLESWGADEDRFTFEDSDRFEEDSLCSWSSEPESLCNNWRGWKRPGTQGTVFGPSSKRSSEEEDRSVASLAELTARCVASHIPFELVEHVYPPVPEQLQLRIAFWSFPDNEEDIRLYSCLANGSADEFQRGDYLYRNKAVRDPLQIGFHLSASVVPPPTTSSREQFNVAVTFDRRRITSCNCTCSSTAYWCSHVVAVCLHRINKPDKVCLRAPVSESLSRLHREQLQKFAQYLISELPQQILPTAQRLLDELLSSQPSAINSVCGAPDPTAGASVSDQTSWYLDQKTLHDNIKKILIKFCVPAPIVFSDVNYLSTTAPPAAAEWSSLLRPLRGREPEGMWNLLSIVREMFKRNDRNAVPLLEIITEECMACEQILVWWFNTCVALHSGGGGGKHAGGNSNAHASQHACSSLCDEIVVLWRLAALNPGISPEERLLLEKKFVDWHTKIIEKVTKSRGNVLVGNNANNVFPGFNPAIQACRLDWEDYPLPGITYTVGSNQLYHCPFTCFRHSEGNVNQVNSSHAVLNCHPNSQYHPHHYGKHHRRMLDFYLRRHNREHKIAASRNGNRSSVSSEGFCENDADADLPSDSRAITNEQDDADSQEGGGSDSASSSDVGTSCRGGHKSGNNERRVNTDSNKKARSFAMKEQSQSSEDSDMGVFTNGSSSHHPRRLKRTDENTASTSDVSKHTKPNKCIRNSNVSLINNVNNDLNSENVVNKERTECESEGDSPRRASNDSATSNSDSQQSGDEYNVYYFSKTANQGETAPAATTTETNPEKEEPEKDKSKDDPWDILFARAEGLHAHGHGLEACTLAVRLALELLANPPNLMIELPQIPTKGKRRKVNPASHQISCLASATLAKCAFLCSVLTEVSDHHHLAFRVGLFGLEMARPPASTKPLEVKLANQESDLVNLVKRIPLGPKEFAIVREKAEQLRDGTLRSRGEALLPIMLASFIFDALEGSPSLRENKGHYLDLRKPGDETLAFEAAVAALGLKANVSEADHPLLCEGTRRQRGDLAITLLVHYKDEPSKLARIMEKLLDREVHNLIKTPLCGWYYSTSTHPKAIQSKRLGQGGEEDAESLASAPFPGFEGIVPEAANPRSRPHSSTSAELEQGLASINISAAPPAQITRGKDTPRFKGKRMYPSIPNQPSEAGAHFMFELAKTVLNKAGGNSSTSLFTQATTSQQHHGPHRALHFCAFQIGLYALGLHNCVSPNWLSRTYSSHVSWITGQAMEIGALAISFLIDTWEGHLTPPEAASIADRASRGCDPNMVRAAAELALSCLPHAHALNPNEIQRAIVQCKEQSELMLEHSCLTVENAAKGGGVYPEVLFQVAKYWYDLYMRHTPGGDQSAEIDGPHDPMSLHFSLDPNVSVVALVEPQELQQHPPMPPQLPPNVSANMTMMPPPPPQGGVVMTTAPPPLLPVPYAVAPYSFTVHPFHALPPPSHLGLYLSPPPYQFQNPQPGPVPQQYFVPGNSQPPMRPVAYPITTMQQVVPNQNQLQIVQPQNVTVTSTVNVGLPQPGPVPVPVSVNQPVPPIVPGRPPPQPQVVHRQGQTQYTTAQFRCLLAAYRVGMLALETLARRVHDDRPQAKYARNPPYGEDVKWLLRVSKKLGTQYLHQFCVCVVNSIVSPFILHDVALEAAHYLARNNPTLILQHLRSALTPLVQKCQQMYIQCMHQKLYHLTSSDYEEFVNVVCAARAAFHITPEGSQQFKEWLQSIRRSKSCKKDLWTQINTALQTNNK